MIPSPSEWEKFRDLLIANQFENKQTYLDTNKGREDLRWHLHLRSKKFSNLYRPWLDAIGALRGRRILEIGSGTGSSTLMMAMAGAQVTALDVDEASLACCRMRIDMHGLRLQDSICENATEYLRRTGKSYDAIMFSATLEHMTTEEKLVSLQLAWEKLGLGGHLGVIECPNRLWYFDEHTSLAPFWMWLPDDIAIQYLAMMGRKSTSGEMQTLPADDLQLARAGRGVSFHEFEMAGLPVSRDRRISSLQLRVRNRNPLKILKWLCARRGAYERLLVHLAPSIHPAFFQPHIDLVMTKD